MKKIIFLITLLVYLIPQNQALAAGATLSLSPPDGTINKGCSYTVDILLDTGGNDTEGADVNLIFDPSKISITNLQEGNTYPDYAAKTYDNQNGTITFSAITQINQSFNGTGKFATIFFTVNPTATTSLTQINFDFNTSNKKDTTDSNVVQTGTAEDILDSVTNGTYTVGVGVCSPSSSATPTPTRTATPFPAGGPATSTPSAFTPPPTLPPAGITSPTLLLSITGTVLVVLGILGLAIL